MMHSLQCQREIFLKGLAAQTPMTPISFAGSEQSARQLLTREAFAYLAGGAGSERTIDFSRQALDLVKIHPRMLGGVQEVSMQLKWREHTLPAPFISSDCSAIAEIHSDLISHPWKTT